VVIHTLEGVQKRGTVRNVDLSSYAIELLLPDGGREMLDTKLIKAVFFMVPIGQPVPKPEGAPIAVTLQDGRQLKGQSPDYQPGGAGFFLYPSDQRSRAGRIYIYASAVREIS